MKACLALILMFAPVAAAFAADHDTSSSHHDNSSLSISTKALADQISEIAHASNLSLQQKDEQISAAVHSAVSSAIAQLTDPSDIVKITEELTTAAAASAPQFARAIVDAVANISAISSIRGAVNSIKDAVVDAAAKSAGAAFESNDDKHGHGHHGGDDDDDDHPISPSH